MTERTHEWQLAELEKPVDPKFIQQKPEVKGPYTTGDYVRWQLNRIFGADNWSFTILDGPKIIELNPSNAYAQATCRLTVQFADGQQAMHDDVGVWPLSAGREKDGKEKMLDDAAPERFETVTKACVTDAVKACAEQLGLCFRPITDKALITHLAAEKKPVGNPPDPTVVQRSLEGKIVELFPNDVAPATLWLVQRYTGHATPRNIRHRIDNLTTSEHQAILDALTEKPDFYRAQFSEFSDRKVKNVTGKQTEGATGK